MAWVTKDSTETYNQTPEPPREYTKKEKAANWWHYHWMAVVVAVLVVVFGVWIIKDTVFQTRPDVQVAYVGTSDLPTDTVTALQDALTPFCSDLNGDGKVVVQVDSYTVDFDAANENTDAYYQMAGVTRLSAELSSGGKTYIFLLEDPEGFEAQTGALQYLDGTVPDDPETTDADWREMVYRWTDCPVLTGLDLGGYEGLTLMDDVTGTNQSVLAHLYVGRRGVWDEKQVPTYEGCAELWDMAKKFALWLSLKNSVAKKLINGHIIHADRQEIAATRNTCLSLPGVNQPVAMRMAVGPTRNVSSKKPMTPMMGSSLRAAAKMKFCIPPTSSAIL